MNPRRNRLVPVLLAAVLLVGAANIGAFAATGGPLLLGKSNTANKTTTLKTTGNGAALKLKSKAGKAPLKVSNNTKVKKLNADLVDGLDSAALQTKSFVYNLTASGVTDSFVVFSLPGLPPGKYLASLNINAAVAGSPSFLICYVLNGSGLTVEAPVLAPGVDSGGLWLMSGASYVDTTTVPHRVGCQQSGGTSMTIPAVPNFPARATFTRVDDATSASQTGVSSTVPKPVARLFK